MNLTPEQIERQKRHIMLKEIGGSGVKRLREASVSIVGAGALGGPCAMYLAAAGIGQIELFDDDTVERSNLQRQVQFGEQDIGASKVETLARNLEAAHSDVSIIAHAARWTDQALTGDILIDATDNFETRYSLNDVAIKSEKYLVHGAAAGWTGQVSVFAAGVDAEAPCYRCWVPEAPPDATGCDEVGVVGPVTGLVALNMALEAIKLVTVSGVPLVGRILLIDGLGSDNRTLRLRRDPACRSCG